MSHIRLILPTLFLLLPFTAVHASDPAEAPVVETGTELPHHIELPVGDTLLLPVHPQRVAVGNGTVLSVSRPETGQLLLLAEKPGRTSVQLWLADARRHRIQVEVTAVPGSALLAEVRELLGDIPGLDSRWTGSHVVLQGVGLGAAAVERVGRVAAIYPDRVLNLVEGRGSQPLIQMDVQLVEVRRDRLSDLGLRWDSEAQGPQLSVNATTRGGGWRTALSLSSVIGSRLALLEQQGLAEVVANPMLACRSGGTARFISGGEVPIPVIDGLGGTDVQYKEYGIILDLKPEADSSGAVHAAVDAELSQIDASVRVQGYPGFVKRRSSTSVDLKAGETLVIAGLLARERGRSIEAVPTLGRLPGVGRLFGARHRQSRQTELVVLITPTIVTARAATADTPGAPADWDAAARRLSMPATQGEGRHE